MRRVVHGSEMGTGELLLSSLARGQGAHPRGSTVTSSHRLDVLTAGLARSLVVTHHLVGRSGTVDQC
jgi:hypothetical protein